LISARSSSANRTAESPFSPGKIKANP
jgi:hypothetical protein